MSATSHTTTAEPLPKEVTEQLALLDGVSAQLRIYAESLHVHVASIRKVIAAFKQRTKPQIDFINCITETRSLLQLFSHSLETDADQRWRPARLPTSTSNKHQQTTSSTKDKLVPRVCNPQLLLQQTGKSLDRVLQFERTIQDAYQHLVCAFNAIHSNESDMKGTVTRQTYRHWTWKML